jgi:hypothetical protein
MRHTPEQGLLEQRKVLGMLRESAGLLLGPGASGEQHRRIQKLELQGTCRVGDIAAQRRRDDNSIGDDL